MPDDIGNPPGNPPGGNDNPPSGGDPDPPSGSTSSGGGSSSSQGLTAKQRANLEHAYLEVLHAWGLNASQGGLMALVNQAVAGEMSTTQFKHLVRRTKVYRQAFPGIQRGQSEAEYLGRYRAYQAEARGFRNLTKEQFAALQKNGVNIGEWRTRVEAFKTMKQYAPLFNEFEAVLRSRGLLGKVGGKNYQLSRKELFNFITRRGDPQWEGIWQEAVARQGLQEAGFSIGKRGDISRKELLRMIRRSEARMPGFEVEAEGVAGFAKLAQQAKEVLPLSGWYGEGITKSDLLELQFGGKRATEIADKVQRVMARFQSDQQDTKANPQLIQTQRGSRLDVGGLSGEEGY